MTKILPNKFLLSEKFYSIQGEGKSSGVPSYFIRLTTCDLQCGSSIQYINKIKKGEINPDLNDAFIGDLEKEGKATWSCDTTPVWLRGNYVEFEELINGWKEEGLYDNIRNGLIHLIWTGGEPTIRQHQESIINFDRFWQLYDNGGQKCKVYHEIETNGRNYIHDDLFNILDHHYQNPTPRMWGFLMTYQRR